MTLLEIAQTYFDAWNRHDAAGIVSVIADGGTYSDPAAGTLSGLAIADYADALFAAFPDLEFELVSAGVAGEGRLVAEWIMRGTNSGSFAGAPPTGRCIALPGADFITLDGDGIRAVQGYFDQRTFVEQLGLQVIVQPHAVGPFTFGNAVRVHAGNAAEPGAVSLTWIEVRSEEEKEYVREASRQIAVEMTRMSGFISWIGVIIANRLYTVTAWEQPEDAHQVMRNGIHKDAVRRTFGPDFAAALQTSVWSLHHSSPLRVRCPACGQLVTYDGACTCGAPLPQAPAYL
jgi:steroid delta-isomerase-like uncharacterized protein